MLKHRTTGAYKIMKVRLNTIVIDKNGVHNTVSMHRVRRAPYTSLEDGGVTTNTSEEQAATPEDTQSSNQEHEHTVERIVGHCGQGVGRRYTVCWYVYRPEDNTVETAINIPQHFIARYRYYRFFFLWPFSKAPKEKVQKNTYRTYEHTGRSLSYNKRKKKRTPLLNLQKS